MNLSGIDLSWLPDLDRLAGLAGGLADAVRVQSSDDTIVVLMSFLYELIAAKGLA